MSFVKFDSPFHATEVDSDVADALTLKADLMIFIRDLIQKEGWTQTEAAEIMGTKQPRISDVVNGKLDKFTLDMLFTFLSNIGFKIQLNIGSLDQSSITFNR